jgi:hypothetical protein
MDNQLKRLISLSKKTGEKLVVFDHQDYNSAYVIMPVAHYEELLGLEPHSLIGEPENNDSEKNQSFQQAQAEKPLTSNGSADKMNNNDKMWKEDKDFQKENVYSSGQIIKSRFNNNWQIPDDAKKAAAQTE